MPVRVGHAYITHIRKLKCVLHSTFVYTYASMDRVVALIAALASLRYKNLEAHWDGVVK